MEKVINVGVIGAGKMSGMVIELINKDPELKLVFVVEKDGHPSIGKEMYGIKVIDDLYLGINGADVLADFTSPEATIFNLDIATQCRKPMVIGTTGLSSDQIVHLKECAEFIPILYSANMSYGMNLLFKVIGEMAKDLSDYDVEIIEAHHRRKVDAPSGTAKKLAEIIACARALELEDVAVHGRKGKVGARKKEEIGIMAIRAGDIVGDHTILFGGDGERIEIVHRVTSRECFAQGALKATKFLVGQDPGLYSMNDLMI